MMAPRHLGDHDSWARFELAELALYAIITLVTSLTATYAIAVALRFFTL